MKLYIAVLLLAAAVFADVSEETKEKFKKISSDCQAETGITTEEIKKIRHAQFSGDAKEKAQILCVNKKIGFINDAFEIQFDAIKSKVSPVVGADTVEAAVEKCKESKGTDAEGTAYEFFKCYATEIHLSEHTEH